MSPWKASYLLFASVSKVGLRAFGENYIFHRFVNSELSVIEQMAGEDFSDFVLSPDL